jgi:hypothetical protein
MKKTLLLMSLLPIVISVNAQYPFDKFAKPDFKLYDSWKLIEKPDDKKIHLTVSIPNFYADSIRLTIQFTFNDSKQHTENILRIYSGNSTIQSFRHDVVDYMPNHISSYPLKIADLNGDNLLDIKIVYDYHSQGLHLSYRLIYLLQQKDGTFIKYSFDNMFEERLDFERDLDNDGTFEILSVTLVGIEGHNYWRFDVFQLDGENLVDANAKFDFPVFIQFLKKRNYTQTARDFSDGSDERAKDLNLIVDKGVILK